VTRLLTTLKLDAALQFRNGFYYVAVFVAVLTIVLLRSFLTSEEIAYFLPPIFLLMIPASTFYFIGGLILLEKGEGTLEGLVMTPLRTGEYIISKTVSLTFLATCESLCIVGFTFGFDRGLPVLFAGIVVMAVIYTLLGFAFSVQYASIMDYLMPAVVFASVLQLPFIHYFELWDFPIFYLWPTQAPLILMKAAFEPVVLWEKVYAVSYSIISVAFAYRWCERAFYRDIILKERNA